jgi:hypothetical protein
LQQQLGKRRGVRLLSSGMCRSGERARNGSKVLPGPTTPNRLLSTQRSRLGFVRVTSRAIAQAVSRRLPTTAAWVQAQVRSCEICGGQSGTGAGFLRPLRFPLPILIPLIAPHSSPINRGWCKRPVSGRRTKWTQSHRTTKN